jgi:PilZ domain
MINSSASGEIFKCAVVNVSDSGINLFISRPLDMGQEITIRGDVPNLARTAVVRWTRKLGEFYTAGLQCNELKGDKE